MTLKDRIKILVLGSLGFLLLYFFIATKPLYNDLYFFPLWSFPIEENVSIEKTTSIEGKEAKLYPFFIENKFGYFSEDGHLFSLSETYQKVSASSSYWAPYTSYSSSIPIYKSDGSLVCTINASGFPYIVEDRIYLFESGGYGVSEYNKKGELLWHYAHSAAITAFSSSKNGIAIGYSDGKIAFLNKEGSEVFNLYPGGSAYQVISGLALSSDGQFIACISGIDKQRFLLIRIMDKQYKIIKHEYLNSNLYRQAFVSFDDKGSLIIFETGDGIGLLDCYSHQLYFLDEKAPIVDIGDNVDQKLITILTKKNNECHLIIIEKPFTKIASTSFVAKDTFLLQDGKKIFIGTSNRISAVEVKN